MQKSKKNDAVKLLPEVHIFPKVTHVNVIKCHLPLGVELAEKCECYKVTKHMMEANNPVQRTLLQNILPFSEEFSWQRLF